MEENHTELHISSVSKNVKFSQKFIVNIQLKDLDTFPSTDAAMLAKRRLAASKKYGHSSIFIFPVVTEVLHILQLEVRVSCFLTSLDRSFRYLVLVGRRSRGSGGTSTESGPKPGAASSVSLDFTLRSPTEIQEEKRKNLNNLRLLTDGDTPPRSLQVIISSLENTSHYRSAPGGK